MNDFGRNPRHRSAVARWLSLGAVESYRDTVGKLWVGTVGPGESMEVLASLGGRVWVVGGIENGPDALSYLASHNREDNQR